MIFLKNVVFLYKNNYSQKDCKVKKYIQHLNSVSEKVNKILKNDNFPDSIEPDYLRDEIRIYPLAGGKKLRPALLCASCGVLGGDIEKIIYFAAALEVWHNWTLVHDDIIDCDTFRRNMPSAHCRLANIAQERFALERNRAMKYGQDMAILCGDLQINWAYDLILKGQAISQISPEFTLEIIGKIRQYGVQKLITGEAVDTELSLRNITEISIDEVMKMIDGKTSALFQCCTEIGGALALGKFNDFRVGLLSDFAKALGRAFQLQDDLLGVFGEEQKLGKNIGSDLRESKPTVLLLKTLSNTKGTEKEFVLSVIGKKDLQVAEFEKLKDIIVSSNAYKFVADEVQYYLQRAKEFLDEVPDNEYNQILHEILEYLVNRDR